MNQLRTKIRNESLNCITDDQLRLCTAAPLPRLLKLTMTKFFGRFFNNESIRLCGRIEDFLGAKQTHDRTNDALHEIVKVTVVNRIQHCNHKSIWMFVHEADSKACGLRHLFNGRKALQFSGMENVFVEPARNSMKVHAQAERWRNE
jgi:hypothetical protein